MQSMLQFVFTFTLLVMLILTTARLLEQHEVTG